MVVIIQDLVKEEEREELMGSAMQTTDKVSRKCQVL